MSRLKTVRKKHSSTPTTKVRGKIAPLASEARVAATTAAATAGTAAVTAAGTASHAASHAAGAAKHWAAPRVDTAVGQAARGVDTAVAWASPRIEAAKGSAKDWAAPRVEGAKGWVAPKVAEALAASEPVRKEALSRGTAAVAALKGELPPPASARIGAGPAPRSSGSAFGRRLGQLMMLLGLSGGAFAGWRNWSAKQSSEPEPWSPPTATPQSVRPIGSASARTPYTPPAPTTPDNPATVTHISSSGRSTTSSTAPATGTSSGLGGGLGDVGAPQSHDIAGASPDEAIADSTAAVDEGRKP